MIDKLTIIMNFDGVPILVDTRGIDNDLFCKLVAGLQGSEALKAFKLGNIETISIKDFLELLNRNENKLQ